jgi:alpha-glucosidase
VDAPDRPAGAAPWWRDAVIYQIYVRSFADGNDDGLGDLPGIRSRLDVIAALGVDAVWLTPFYPSPLADGGYDVADHRDVDPRLGTLADLDALVADAHALGLRVLIDLVPNHTSDQHRWFRDALAAGRGSPERARYLFRDGRGHDGDRPPNDWNSVFGGGAWERVVEPDGTAGQWYLHLFAPEQPDLDWTNPEVRAEFEAILRFWFDRGVDGFRVDVAHGLAKDPDMPDIAGRYPASGPAPLGHPHWDQDEVHDVYRSWRRVSDAYDGDRTFVAEAWVDRADRLARYVRGDELHTAFDFNLLLAPWDAPAMRETIERSIAALGSVGAPPTWVLSNHDVVRHTTRYGGGEVGQRRARAAALLLLALPGGAYVYQGEELGLEEVLDLPDDVLQDPTFVRTGGTDRGRDGCRVPLPWSGDTPPFGFGVRSTPWLPQPAAWADRTVVRQRADPASMWSLYRDALGLRHREPALGDGELGWLEPVVRHDDILAFRRPPDIVCVLNTGAARVPLAEVVPTHFEVLLASTPVGLDGAVDADAAVWLRTRGS